MSKIYPLSLLQGRKLMNQYLFLRTLAQSQLCKVKLAYDIRDQTRYYVRARID